MVIPALLIGLTVILLIIGAADAAPSRPRSVTQRLSELRRLGYAGVSAEHSGRQDRRAQFELFLRRLGSKVDQGRKDAAEIRQRLIQAGYRSPTAPAVFWGVRLFLTAGLGLSLLAIGAASGAAPNMLLVRGLSAAALGWVGPSFYVGRKQKKRKLKIQKALPDALDLMVVCVEAGLGLNQALVRVSEEIRHVSLEMSEEMALVNLEIRAGAERQQALRNLAERTGVDDVRALTAILIQTDRFGTSVSTALRTQADTMRTKRRQRAEEAAAKTTIKLIPPLVFCVFPAIFTVILGPAAIQIYRVLVTGGGFGG
ncbi:MAG: type II secretion system F family protein [Gemmatimonadota bacterium]